ncbi:DUF7882 family protein [Lysinibacter cavernae]|uniref:DUF7882 domain-containing protein n=1 Tax=Lysinibacter cavernae TaxID=1640652 RepID=A0A7X5R2F1_9MICO|nr:hypothetical protein [Lysinibacter cavernae]NIH54349.1 hypothetical protein [Lysinibacter cavernae]
MGRLTYGTNEFEFDDCLLAHLKVVVIQKLRRKETFLLSWSNHDDSGACLDGRHAIWLTDGIQLYFHVEQSEKFSLNRRLLDYMVGQSHSPDGLILDEKVHRLLTRDS